MSIPLPLIFGMLYHYNKLILTKKLHNSIPAQVGPYSQQYGTHCDAASSQLAGYHILHRELSSTFYSQGHSSGFSLHEHQLDLDFF